MAHQAVVCTGHKCTGQGIVATLHYFYLLTCSPWPNNNWWLIIDQPNFVQYKRNLIDTDLLDYYHIRNLHHYTTKICTTQNLLRLDTHGPSMACQLNAAWAILWSNWYLKMRRSVHVRIVCFYLINSMQKGGVYSLFLSYIVLINLTVLVHTNWFLHLNLLFLFFFRNTFNSVWLSDAS